MTLALHETYDRIRKERRREIPAVMTKAPAPVPITA